ncbi:MAG: hypothetical protein OXI22_23325 [Defluviicoccus sp.]|nr:hypothetical protein [Defluviicoccus sp.]MDE0386832.1 hypothetical protein [Defluviicoccus sp.]
MNAGAQDVAAPLLWGSLEAFPLARILGGLALSRQLVGVRFSDQDRAVGEIVLKAGQVVDAMDYRTQASGADALAAMIRNPGTAFEVFWLEETFRENAEAIGKLAELAPDLHGESGWAPEPARGAAGLETHGAGEKVRVGRFSIERRSAAPVGDGPGDPGGPDNVVSAAFAARGRLEASPPAGPEDAVEPEGRDQDAGSGEILVPVPQLTAPERQHEVPELGGSVVILRGNLSDIGFEEILEVLELDPRRLLVSFLRGGEEVGTVDMMSQRVLGASAVGLSGREAFEQLYADPGETFEVRSARDATASAALGTVDEMLVAARAANRAAPIQQATPHSERALFMEGRLTDFPLEVLIASLNLSRQPIELELCRDEVVLHRVLAKAGQVLSAMSASGNDGAATLAAIREDPGSEFVVYRRRELANGVPLAPLRRLLLDGDIGDDAMSPMPDAAPVPGPAMPEIPAAPEEDLPLQQIGGRAKTDTAGLRDALEELRRTLSETTQVAHALSRTETETAALLTALESTHKAALAEIRVAHLDPRQRRRGERALLGFILALQLACLAAVGGLLFLAVT